MKSRLLAALPPPAADALRWSANRVYPSRRRDRAKQRLLADIGRSVYSATGGVVARGPFTGLRYPPTANDLAAKLLGAYEAELHAVVGDAIQRGYRRVVNIGCGEGYYAVGLARALPDAKVWAFDIDEASQRACRAVAELNGVSDRVTVAAECTSAELAKLAGPDALLVVDCEGCEVDLLDPSVTPPLADTDILVELHDFVVDGAARILADRFDATHARMVVRTASRNPSDYPELAALSPAHRDLAVDERRPVDMEWFWLTGSSAPKDAR